ncbi:unnamed protein product [Caenorhabditis angaria]|uniref:Uncharacterized protein n=1 Tax=Caenorhabditis angaria TaxID=860376 RepID=A0A9P1IR86_9PELO|nr:unnamed protein product [Caenorhabditis angaria]
MNRMHTFEKCDNFSDTLIIEILNISTLLLIFITNWIYISIYRLVKQLNDQATEMCFIYQFSPISIHQLFYTITICLSQLLIHLDYQNIIISQIFDMSMFALYHLLPFVISMSYIASKQNLRHFFRSTILSVFAHSETAFNG